MGGVAGDMFAACLFDAAPDLRADVLSRIEHSKIGGMVRIAVDAGVDKGIKGARVAVTPVSEDAHHNRAYADIISIIKTAGLAEAEAETACAIFTLLAGAEAKIHGLAPDDVVFHEVGAWDSVVDVVMAAMLIEALSATWSCGPLPIGSGTVNAAHGVLPVPAPAAAVLLQGFDMRADGAAGERVTPTGAAILKYLAPAPSPPAGPMRLECSGFGLGHAALDGVSNALRALVFSESAAGARSENIAELRFEIDDQSPEDLAAGLDNIRAMPGVLDAVQSPVFGKKGRMAAQVQILCRREVMDAVTDACFLETTTLGVRRQTVNRRVIERSISVHDSGGGEVRVKTALRPGAKRTAKAEMDDLKDRPGGHAGRGQARAAAEGARGAKSGGGRDS